MGTIKHRIKELKVKPLGIAYFRTDMCRSFVPNTNRLQNNLLSDGLVSIWTNILFCTEQKIGIGIDGTENECSSDENVKVDELSD